MPAIAGLLIVVGVGTVKPSKIMSVARTGRVPLTVMILTLVLTMVIPLQYSVLVGVMISVLLFVVGQSSRLVTKRLVFHPDGRIELTDPPAAVPPGEVVVLQPYGSIFFATAQTLRDQLPAVTSTTRNSVVVVRIRGADDAGSTVMDVLATYASDLRGAGSRLAVVTDSDRVTRQLRQTGVARLMGSERLYRSSVFIGEATRRAHDDAADWIARNRDDRGTDDDHDEDGDDGD